MHAGERVVLPLCFCAAMPVHSPMHPPIEELPIHLHALHTCADKEFMKEFRTETLPEMQTAKQKIFCNS